MCFSKFSILAWVLVLFLGVTTASAQINIKVNENPGPVTQNKTDQGYACEEDLIEVMFEWDSKVRLRKGALTDLATNALDGADEVLRKVSWFEWQRICEVPEERLDEIQFRGEANTGKPVYNLNNIYRLRIPEGHDVWEISKELEALPGIMLARPVPKPMPLPTPPDYEPQQGYLDPASSTPTGIDAEYTWTQPGGDGTGVTICDLEYGWNYNHGDIGKAQNSQINPNTILYPANADTNHGTAVIGELVSDSNGWGTTGICYGANLKTCGTYWIDPGPPLDTVWNVPGAMAYAIDGLSAGDVILLEQQWAYTYGGTDYIPIEWWLDYFPNPQSYNGVYAAVVNAVSNGIHVVEAGGNGGVNTDNLTWYGNSGAIIVGAGGAYPGGIYPEGDLQRLSFSSYGSRFNLQGWGEDVVTTGYGDLYSAEGYNYWYTSGFAGTSSASPIVAGAVACCVGSWTARGFSASSLTPAMLRDTLVTTGTPQITPPLGHIGPRPDLQAAFTSLFPEWVDVSSDPLWDAGPGLGVAWGDYENDGDQDIYLTNYNQANKLFQNQGGGAFVDVTSAPLADTALGRGVAWGDYNNDGDLDLYLANDYDGSTTNKLFRNDGSGAFSDVTAPPLNDNLDGLNVVWGDYNNDGNLDLYLVNLNSACKLFRNDGSGVFVDVTSTAFPTTPWGNAGVAWGDYNNDGYLDLYEGTHGGANKLWRNQGNGTFFDATAATGVGDTGNAKGVAWGDYDNDGYLDLYVANYGTANKLFRNINGGWFADSTSGPLGDTGYTTGMTWGDYDNDGDLDLYMVNGTTGAKLLRNEGGGAFSDATSGPLGSVAAGYGVAFADYDNDGDLDIYLAVYSGSNRLFRNDIGSKNHWLHVNLVGTVSNTAAIGARVRVVSGGLSQIREISGGSGYHSQNSLTAEFGLGSATQADTVEVRWPSGQVDTMTAVSVDRLLTLYEGGFMRGDANGDGVINSADVVYLINYLFKGGPAPNPLWVGDTNSDGTINSADVVYLINYLFKGGPPPACP